MPLKKSRELLLAIKKEDKLTFFMATEKLQLLLLLPPQRVDDGDGQPKSFLGVTVRSQGIHSGTRRRDMLCDRQGFKKSRRRKHFILRVFSFLIFTEWMETFRSLTVPQGPPSGVKEGAVEVVMVTVVVVVVLCDDVLQVEVLPV